MFPDTKGPPPGWGIPRGMDGGGPLDTAVTSPFPLLTGFIPKALVFQGPTWGPLLQTAIKIKRLRVISSHIVQSKADIELRLNCEGENIDQKNSPVVFFWVADFSRAASNSACGGYEIKTRNQVPHQGVLMYV